MCAVRWQAGIGGGHLYPRPTCAPGRRYDSGVPGSVSGCRLCYHVGMDVEGRPHSVTQVV